MEIKLNYTYIVEENIEENKIRINGFLLYICSSCNQLFMDMNWYKKHISKCAIWKKKYEENGIYKCECCKFVSLYQSNYDKHLKTDKHITNTQ